MKGEFVSLTKYNVFGATGKTTSCWSMFAIEPIAEYSLFLNYWPSKNGSRDHDVKGESVSLEKPIPIARSTTKKKSFSYANYFINRNLQYLNA